MLNLLFAILSFLGMKAVSDDVREEVVGSPRVAQVRLAETLAGADAIHGVRASGTTITFTISRGEKLFDVVVTTRARRTANAPKGEVMSLAIVSPTGKATSDLSWLGEELASVTAITKLAVDEDGAITLTANDGRRYMVIPGRGSGGGNDAVEARWAAEWNH